jgi:hypothetical protein
MGAKLTLGANSCCLNRRQGLDVTNLDPEFWQRYHRPINAALFGFSCIEDLLLNFPNLFSVWCRFRESVFGRKVFD